ncbi:MAG: alpha/beta hydrolase [Myxococcales bacterium]|nr:alpha/beta hydrolase [Myxococcales bacterium]
MKRSRWATVARAALVSPLLLLAGLALLGPPSLEGGLFAVALVVAACGFVARQRGVTRGALVVMVTLVVARLTFAGEGRELRATSGRLLDRVLPERDVALGASRLLLWAGVVDEPGLLEALRGGYARMRADQGWVPSPVLSTLVLGQTPEDYVTLELRPAAASEDLVVVFLHGSMGNVTLECWQVAHVARAAGLATLCPSTDLSGRWDRPNGRAILEGTLRDLRARGYRRVVLVGLSAGAIGLARLAPRLGPPSVTSRVRGGEGLELAGVVLISGAADVPRPRRVPTLVLQGARDRMTPPAPARRYAQALGARAQYVELPDAGHWLLLSHHRQLETHLGRWLRERADTSPR